MRKEHIVSEEENGRYLRSLMEEILTNVPAKGIRRAIQRGQIVVNKSRVSSNQILSLGDQISIHIQTATKKSPDKEIPVVYEDDHYAILNKPAGLPVGGGREATVSDFLTQILQQSTADDALLLPRTVHRLDKPTSGLLLVAKTKSALADLSQQFEARSVQKTYHAIVHGHVENAGNIDIALADKAALTYYNPLKTITTKDGSDTLIELNPKTGRTHQLRKHMAYIGHPILGDYKYGKDMSRIKNELMLCATKLAFKHPYSKEEVQCEIDPPSIFDTFQKQAQPANYNHKT